MKNLKYLSVILMLFIGVNIVHAQQDKQMDRKQQMDRNRMHNQDNDYYKRMHKELSLTDDQMKKAEDIRSKRADEMRKLSDQMKRLKEEERKEMQAIYTPEQQEKLKKYEEKYKDGMRANREKMRKDKMYEKNMQDKTQDNKQLDNNKMKNKKMKNKKNRR